MDFTLKYLAPGEDWAKLADRVSGIMQYSDERERIKSLITNLDFLPNSPCLINAHKAGARNLAACNIIHVPNSIEGIFDAVKWCGILFKSGAGVGLEFSDLSPHGTQLKYAPGGIASGPVSFMKLFNAAGDVVKEGGLCRAAIMGLLNVNHPDSLAFISCKQRDGVFENFNISVSLDNGPDSVPPDIWDRLVECAWLNGEPGVVYLGNINKTNPTVYTLGKIKGVNACSEYAGYNFSSCVLASLNLPNLVKKIGDYSRLIETTQQVVFFLDRVIDVNPYPLSQIAQATRATRDIGLGVMGWASLLEREGIPFVSGDAISLARDITSTIHAAAGGASFDLACKHGGYQPGERRNRVLTTIAPTGHLATLAGVSKSIYADYGTQLKMTAEEHIDLLAAWMIGVDSSISYTVCFPNGHEKSFVDRIFRMSYERGLKNISVYRDGSRKGQPCKADGTCSL